MPLPSYHDVFISYASEDLHTATRLRDALDVHDCSVWLDKVEIRDLDPITERLENGVNRSLLTVVLVSASQMSSRVCRWEILRSLALGDARGYDRIDLVQIDDALADMSPSPRRRRSIDLRTTAVDDAAAALFERVKEARALDTDAWGEEDAIDTTVKRGIPGGSGHRYFGRLPELQAIYDSLCGPWRHMDRGHISRHDACVVQGMGGVGKSILATFFAEQFARSFSGGVVWLGAGGDQVDNDAASLEAKDETFLRLGDAVLECASEPPVIVIPTEAVPIEPRKRWRHLCQEVVPEFGQGQRTLLIIDDLPRGIDAKDVCPDAENVAVLITARDAVHAAQGIHLVKLEPFDIDEGVLFLADALDPTRSIRRAGGDPFDGEAKQARALVEAVGSHPLALDLLAVRIIEQRDRIADLLHEIEAQAERFLDLPAYAADLPTQHTPSILATVSGSLRSLHSTDAAGVVLPMLRAMMVLPAGQAIPHDLMERVAGHDARSGAHVLHDRSVAKLDHDGIRFHALTRGVARILWDQQSEPFGSCREMEPGLSLTIATWLHETAEEEGLTPTALRLARELIDVIDDVTVTFPDAVGPDQRRQRSEAWLRLARERNRTPAPLTDKDPEAAEQWAKDLEAAEQWAEEAKRDLPKGRPDLEGMQWWRAEAMQALLRSKLNEQRIKKGDAEARKHVLVILERLIRSAEVREEYAEVLLADPAIDEASRDWIAVNRMAAKGNLPGRYLDIAKLHADDGASDDTVGEYLDLMELTHHELIVLREAHTNPRIADLASNHEGLGSVAYHRAVLLTESGSAKTQHLRSALAPLIESIQLRTSVKNLQDEVDISKSLRLLLKVTVAIAALDGGPQEAQSLLTDHHATAASEVSALEPGDYRGGPGSAEQATRDQTAAGRYRDAQARSILDAGDVTAPDIAGLIGACVRWLVVADERTADPEGRQARRVTVDDVAKALFDIDNEIARMMDTMA